MLHDHAYLNNIYKYIYFCFNLVTKHCLEMIMKKRKKAPFGIILAFVSNSFSIKAKQICPLISLSDLIL